MEGRHQNNDRPGGSQQDSHSQPGSPYFISPRTDVQGAQQEVQLAHTQLLQSIEMMRVWQSNVQKQISDLTNKLRESEEVRERQHQNLVDVQMNLEQVSFRYDAELKNREALSAKIAQTRNVNEILQNHCKILSETMQRLRSERDRLTTQFDDQFKQICDLEVKYGGLKTQYTDKIENLNRSLQEEQTKSERERVRVDNCYEMLKEAMEAKLCQERSRLVDVEKELAEAKRQIEEMKKAEILTLQLRSEELNALKEDFDQLSLRKDELEKLLLDAQGENANLKIVAVDKERVEEELTQAMNKILQLDTDVMKHKKTEEELNASIASLRNEMERINIESESAVSQLIIQESVLSKKLEEMKIQYEENVCDLKRTLSDAQNKASVVEASLRYQVETLQAECETLKVQAQEMEQALKQKLQAAQDLTAELKKEISNITEEYQHSKMCSDEQRKHLEDQIQAHRAAEQQMTQEITEACDELKKSFELQKAAQTAAAEREGVLQAKLLDEKNCVAKLKSDILILTEKQACADSTLAEKERERLQLVEELEKLQKTFEEVSKKGEELSKECSGLKEELEAAMKHVQNKDDEIHNLQNSCQTLESNLQSAKSQVCDLNDIINAKDNEISQLQKLLDESNKTCSELENLSYELKLHAESSKKRTEDDTDLVKEQHLIEISNKNREILELQSKLEGQEQQLIEMQNNLERLRTEFQNNLSLEKGKTELLRSVAVKKDALMEDLHKQLSFSKQQLTNITEQVANLQTKLANAKEEKNAVVIEKDNTLKLFIRDLDNMKKTSEARLNENTTLGNQLKESQNNFHQMQANLSKLQKRYDNASVEFQNVQAQLKQTEAKLQQAESEAMKSKAIAGRIQSEFCAYKAARKRRRVEAACENVLPSQSASQPSAETPCPSTPTNSEAPLTPRSILRSAQTWSPQEPESPKRVRFSADYEDSESGSSSVFQFEPEETMALFSNPKMAKIAVAAKIKEKENQRLQRSKKLKEEDVHVTTSDSPMTQKENRFPSTQSDFPFTKPSNSRHSDASDLDVMDWPE